MGGLPRTVLVFDYPILASVPNTGFSCIGQVPGYYADTSPDAGCQVFHICQVGGRKTSFLCPNGTIFNQQFFVCDWWFNFDCTTADQFYDLNNEIGRVPSRGGGGGGGGSGGGGGGSGGGGGGGGSYAGGGGVRPPSSQYGAPTR
ncbi:U-scoloptoxin(01)-Er1a-like 7 [Homarus americanus]|uniref:U-scoloptoxin(01)-Er1a-like 7 n=1 Tax=Homarus americanus TaxID=6706 RepID=A0A8J5MZA5_HOMAM|nr:U-scoloptoxin(01)-Er1a-like 7 [Homarus americanus]